jgi:hypothetical protein
MAIASWQSGKSSPYSLRTFSIKMFKGYQGMISHVQVLKGKIRLRPSKTIIVHQFVKLKRDLDSSAPKCRHELD